MSNHTIRFPLLRRVTVTECPELKMFSNGDVWTPKLKEVQLAEKIRKNGRGSRSMNLFNSICLWDRFFFFFWVNRTEMLIPTLNGIGKRALIHASNNFLLKKVLWKILSLYCILIIIVQNNVYNVNLQCQYTLVSANRHWVSSPSNRNLVICA